MQNPGQLLGSLSHTGTQQTSRVHTVLEDANEQRFISFSVPPVHGDLHVVDVRQQHIQLSVADKARVLSQPHWHCSTLGTAHPGAKRDRSICPLAWGPIGSVCSTAPTAFSPFLQRRGECTAPLPSRLSNTRGTELLSAGRNHLRPTRPKGTAHLAGWIAMPPPDKLMLMELCRHKPPQGRQLVLL